MPTMKAIMLVEPGRPLEEREVDVPEIGESEVLVGVVAAGICHTDAHYRSGWLKVGRLPVTLGHEVAGVVDRVGAGTSRFRPGDRVCVHYMVSCGKCRPCMGGMDQFCEFGSMIGKDRDGGYAEFVSVPEESVFLLPDEITFEEGAVMMCSSATALHAIGRGRLRAGESVAVWGVGGLGISAVQLAVSLGADRVYAVDLNVRKLEAAGRLGATPVDAAKCDTAGVIAGLTGGRGVDLVLDLVGAPETLKAAIGSIAPGGRIVVAGLGRRPLSIEPYRELLGKEAEIIGASDHTRDEIPRVIEMVMQRSLKPAEAVTGMIPLDPADVNGVLDDLEEGCAGIRTVITPGRLFD